MSVPSQPPRAPAVAVRPVDPEADAPLLHDWFTRPDESLRGLQHASVEDLAREHRVIAASAHRDAYLGVTDDGPVFACERYDPAHRELAAHVDLRPGDVGMDILVAPVAKPVPGLAVAVMRAAVGYLFMDPMVTRVVVEPDVRDHEAHRLHEIVGFEVARTVHLSDKDVSLGFCTRAAFDAAPARTAVG